MADAYIDISRSGVYSIAGNTTKESEGAYLYQPEVCVCVWVCARVDGLSLSYSYSWDVVHSVAIHCHVYGSCCRWETVHH